MWPLPPIIEDYERTCRAIRKENAADTRTATLELRRRFDEGDYPAAASLLEPLLCRRPQLGALWDIAQTLDGIGQLQREVWEDLIDSLLEQDTDNVYCHEWKAASCVKSADSLDSPALQEAKRHLQEAIRLAPNRARPLRTFAQLTSCLGDFEAAVSALRKCRALWPDNTRILGDLAALHVRMGANYFAAAAEELEEAGDAGWGRLQIGRAHV